GAEGAETAADAAGATGAVSRGAWLGGGLVAQPESTRASATRESAPAGRARLRDLEPIVSGSKGPPLGKLWNASLAGRYAREKRTVAKPRSACKNSRRLDVSLLGR